MATERFLIDYLPQYVQEYKEIRAIMEAEQPEVDALWSAMDKAFSDQFILDATEYGVKRWESMLGILPKDTDSLNERKFRILTRLNQELPYTMTRLKESLTTLCGADGFSIELQPEHRHIEVTLALGNHNNYQDVVELLEKVLPANLTKYVKLMYNAHEVLTPFTHEQLSAYTHNQLRNEVLS